MVVQERPEVTFGELGSRRTKGGLARFQNHTDVFPSIEHGNGQGSCMPRRMERSLVDLCDLIYCSVILRLLGMYMRLMTRELSEVVLGMCALSASARAHSASCFT